MRKIILLFIFMFLICPSSMFSAFAESQNELLSKIENDFYGFDYSKDSAQSRIARLEKFVYGKSSSGDVHKRIKKLSSDISADVIGLEIEPARDTFLAEENAKSDSTVDYPIVDEIEQKLFNKTYKNRDLHTRIVTIEKKLFGKVYDVDDYSKRMDRIKEKIMPEVIAKKMHDDYDEYGDGSYYNDSMINSMDFSGSKNKKFNFPFGQKNYSRPYANYGGFDSYDTDFYSKSFPKSDNLNDNLSQMEYDLFGTEFSDDTTENRVKRLNSVNKAKKSSKKYDSNKFSQHMSTAMEIGAMILMILAMVL